MDHGVSRRKAVIGERSHAGLVLGGTEVFDWFAFYI